MSIGETVHESIETSGSQRTSKFLDHPLQMHFLGTQDTHHSNRNLRILPKLESDIGQVLWFPRLPEQHGYLDAVALP